MAIMCNSSQFRMQYTEIYLALMLYILHLQQFAILFTTLKATLQSITTFNTNFYSYKHINRQNPPDYVYTRAH